MLPFDPPPGQRPEPLPGTKAPPRGLFIDRWGTLLELPEHGDCERFSDARFTPRALDALFRAHQTGWYVYLIGNEPAVAEGRISDATWERFRMELLEYMAAYGVPARRVYACLDHPEHGKGRHKRDSVYLLPNTGAMYHAMQHDGIELSESWVVGDSTLELVAGWRASCRLAAVRTGQGLRDRTLEVEPDLFADHLAGALREVLETVGLPER